ERGGVMGGVAQGPGRPFDGWAAAGPAPAHHGPATELEDETVLPDAGDGPTTDRTGADFTGDSTDLPGGNHRRVPLPVCVIAGPTGSGKTTAAAKVVARAGSTCWLSERHEDVEAATAAMEQYGANVGRVKPLDGVTGDTPNCLHPDPIAQWQAKGYNYRPG